MIQVNYDGDFLCRNIAVSLEKCFVWDILPGPCYDEVCIPVDHTQFLALCKHYFPEATLSISWTTGSDMTPQENYYNWSQVISMGKLASQIIQPITFPTRAVLLQCSATQIDWLLWLITCLHHNSLVIIKRQGWSKTLGYTVAETLNFQTIHGSIMISLLNKTKHLKKL